MKRAGEIIFVILMMGGMIVLPAVFGIWPLFFVMLIFSVLFGLMEWLYVAKTDQSVSQHFWEFSKKHKVPAIIVLVGMLVAWLALLWHLGSKLFS